MHFFTRISLSFSFKILNENDIQFTVQLQLGNINYVEKNSRKID